MEIIITLIIIAVLSLLALPKLTSMIEYSKSAEALYSLGNIRRAMQRCFLRNNNTFVSCTAQQEASYNPGDHFTYLVSNQSQTGYAIVATRNTFNGGDGVSTVTLTISALGVTRDGTGVYKSIQ